MRRWRKFRGSGWMAEAPGPEVIPGSPVTGNDGNRNQEDAAHSPLCLRQGGTLYTNAGLVR